MKILACPEVFVKRIRLNWNGFYSNQFRVGFNLTSLVILSIMRSVHVGLTTLRYNLNGGKYVTPDSRDPRPKVLFW